MPATKRAALYLRVSTDGQTTENQRLALVAEAERRRWQVIGEYQDQGISGAKGRDQRPQLDKLLRDATRGKFDVVMAWALDRLGRSLMHLMTISQELESASVDLFLLQQAIDTTSPTGRFFFHVMGAMAEFERGMIVQRVKAGLVRAKKEGKRIGRPKIAHERAQQVRIRLAKGIGIGKVAKELGVGVSTVANIKKAMTASASASTSTAPS